MRRRGRERRIPCRTAEFGRAKLVQSAGSFGRQRRVPRGPVYGKVASMDVARARLEARPELSGKMRARAAKNSINLVPAPARQF